MILRQTINRYRLVLPISLALAFAFLLVRLLSPAAASPGTVISDCSDTGLSNAIALGGSITFSCGPATISISTTKTIAKNATLDGGNLITLTGNYAVGIFYVLPTTTLTLKNMRISEAHSSGSGGAIGSLGKLSIDNVKFINNSADYYGGAIASLSGTLSVINSVFYNNSATGGLGGGGGGAIENGTNVKANLSNNQFLGNYTNENGGVIANNGQLTSTFDLFASNSATVNGGVAYNSFSGTLTINDGELDLNTAYGSGGAIWNEGGIVQINLSTLSENSASTASGGGIENSDGGLVTIKNAILMTNTASSAAGGGIDNNFAAVQLTTTWLIANSAGIGGGLHSIGFASINDSFFKSNSVSGSGGGIYNRGLLTITGWTVFMSNTALYGGAIRNAGGGRLNIDSGQLNDNYADSGGGAISNDGTATVVGTHFILNASIFGHGGAIENAGSYSQTDGVFNNNSTPTDSGGAIYNTSILNVTHVYFDFGSAFTYGGAIHNDTGGRATIARSAIYLNTAGVSGAGIYNNGILTSVNNTIGENFSGSGIHNIGSLVITNSTILHNGDPDINNAGGTTSLHNTIVGTCANPVTNAGHNIQDNLTNSCGLTIPNVDPDLGFLADHGGNILTYNLLPGSPAIDFGDNAGCPPTDARGMRRPVDGNHDGVAKCDAGAYEEQIYVYLPLIKKSS